MLLIGIDAGASKVKGIEVKFNKKQNLFIPGEAFSEYKYIEIEEFQHDFKPIDINIQLKDYEKQELNITEQEKIQGEVYIKAAFKVIKDISSKKGIKDILVGIGIPGLKTQNKRGIAVLKNGPRIPNYSIILEKYLKDYDINLIEKIHYLGSDADFCGIGEEYVKGGLFKGVKNVYYIGCGTGIADAMKLYGELVPFDNTKSWLPKSWEFFSKYGKTFEQLISAKSIMINYGELIGLSYEELNKNKIYLNNIFQFALNGDTKALKVINQVIESLAELLFDRIYTLYIGNNIERKFVKNDRIPLEKKHPYIGTLWERIVIGQRLGQIWNNSLFENIFQSKVKKELSLLIKNNPDLDKYAKSYYLSVLQKDFILGSELLSAPAIGAGIDVYLKYFPSLGYSKNNS